MSGGYARKAEDVSRKLSETLGRLYSQLAGPGSAGRREGGEDAKTTDGGIDRESLTDAVGEVEEVVEGLRSAYEDHIHQVEHEHSQHRTDLEHREQSSSKLLQDYESENESLVERNHSLQEELRALQARLRAAETSLKGKGSAVSSLTEQLGVYQENQQRASASYESRVKEEEEKVEEWRWRVREGEREGKERDKELAQSREMARTIRSTLDECQQQLQNTLQELHRTQQELQSTDTNLRTTVEELATVRHQLQPKEEELQALQEKISDRAQQLMELLDRRSGDYSRQVQEEVVAQSRAYDELLKTLSRTSNGHTSTLAEDSFSPTRTVDMATRLRDFLNPHLLSSHTSLLPPSPSSPHPPPPPHSQSNSDAVTSYQRYLNTFTDFTQRIRVGEFGACPKSKLRQHRLQQWRHHYKEIVLKPAPSLKMEECPLCDVISLMKGVAEKLAVSPSSLLVYTVDRSRSGASNVRLWVLRRALGSTIQYEADSLLADLSLRGHHVSYLSMGDPHGAPSPMEQWEAAHHRVVGRLEESPMVEVIGGGGRGGRGRDRSASLDMVDLDPTLPSGDQNSLLMSSGEEVGTTGGRTGQPGGRGQQVGMARRVGFHLQALLGLLCGCCTAGHCGHHATRYRHLEEMYTFSSNNHVQ